MNPKEMMKGAMKHETHEKKEYQEKGAIHELISRAFTTRNLAHFAHWNSQSYAQHEALGGLYDQIICQIDKIVETYQGKYGLIEGLMTGCSAVPQDITAHVKEEAAWIQSNKASISKNCDAVASLIDDLDAAYLVVIYKLENLK